MGHLQGGRSICNTPRPIDRAIPARKNICFNLNDDHRQQVTAATTSRRNALLTTFVPWRAVLSLPLSAPPAFAENALDLEALATRAYASRDFGVAIRTLDALIRRDPLNARWREMRAAALVDNKRFAEAIADYDTCLRVTSMRASAPASFPDRPRLLAGRGLANEGLSDWVAAIDDYTSALEEAKAAGANPDPYILNSRGNCRASLGEWSLAREDYLASAEGFQSARREVGGAGTLQKRLDGAVFALSNAALMLAQLGDDEKAIKEMQTVARKAPGSADMRAALAAQYWAAGLEVEAENEWEFACSRITVGCSYYQDEEWLRRIRRWPPIMIERLVAFLAVRTASEESQNRFRQIRSMGSNISGFRE
jgi:tetratricopeptide (TPR) repeat protein